MATLILLNKTELPKGTPSEALVAVWDKGSVPDGQISIPVELNERLLPIRDDLAAWTYETGCARINGKLLEEHLRADDHQIRVHSFLPLRPAPAVPVAPRPFHLMIRAVPRVEYERPSCAFRSQLDQGYRTLSTAQPSL